MRVPYAPPYVTSMPIPPPLPQEQIEALGPWGGLLFVLTVMLAEMVPLFPTQPLSLASGILFGAQKVGGLGRLGRGPLGGGDCVRRGSAAHAHCWTGWERGGGAGGIGVVTWLFLHVGSTLCRSNVAVSWVAAVQAVVVQVGTTSGRCMWSLSMSPGSAYDACPCALSISQVASSSPAVPCMCCVNPLDVIRGTATAGWLQCACANVCVLS